MNRAPFCSSCPIGHLTTGYVPLCPSKNPSDWLIVGEAAGKEEAQQSKPFVGGAGSWLNSLLRAARLKREDYSVVNVIGCRPPDNIFPLDSKWKHTSREQARAGIEYCRQHHLEPALKSRQWARIISLGNWALQALTGKRGIELWRGSPLQLNLRGKDAPPVVLPTLHPAFIMRDTTLSNVVIEDLNRSLVVPSEKFNLFATYKDLERWTSKEFAFDLEWDKDGHITLCGISSGYYSATVCDFSDHRNVRELKRIFEGATDITGHNIINADLPHFKNLGWNVTARLHDTMLKQHLVQPMYKHSLAFTASFYTQGVFWKGHGDEAEDEFGEVYEREQWKTWDDPSNGTPIRFGGYLGCTSADEAYRLYNARDTSKSYEVNIPLTSDLDKYELTSLYWNSQVPVAIICQEITQDGWKINPSRVGAIRVQLESDIVDLEAQLPDGLHPYEEAVTKMIPAPPGTYKPKTKKCKGSKKLGTSHDVQEILFTELSNQSCPTCGVVIAPPKLVELKKIKVPSTKRIVPWNSTQQVIKYAESQGIKVENDRKTGNKSADKGVRKVWSKKHTEFLTVNDLKVKKTMLSSFTKEKLKELHRVFYDIKVHGTKEGRFSCAGRRKGLDLNLQQMPKEARTLFMPDHPDWGHLQADWKSGENMLTAHLANDLDRLTRLRQPGYNEHIDLAQRMFDRTITKSKGDETFYKAGKKVNHGRNYGMGPIKLQESLLEETGTLFPLKEVKGFIEEWKRMNPGTAAWQEATIKLAEQQGYLTNPFGRKLWFTSRDYATKALAFLPASSLADIMIRSLIALHGDRFSDELIALKVQRTTIIPAPWRLLIPIHDSFVLQGPGSNYHQVGEQLRVVMTQPWQQLDGFSLDIELEWSGVGGSWGDCLGDKY